MAMNEAMEALADQLDDVLTDTRTWLADAIRRGEGYEALDELRSLCNDAMAAIEFEARHG